MGIVKKTECKSSASIGALTQEAKSTSRTFFIVGLGGEQELIIKQPQPIKRLLDIFS